MAFGARRGSGRFFELPAAFRQRLIDRADRHHLQAILRRERSWRGGTRARVGDVEMIAPCLDRTWRAAIGGNEGAEYGRRLDESAAPTVRLVVVSPFAVDEYFQPSALNCLFG